MKPETITWRGQRSFKVPAPERGLCDGCRYDHDAQGTGECPHTTMAMVCDATKPETDVILIPASSKALAKWVVWRMNSEIDDA